jgi:hypothetical protein
MARTKIQWRTFVTMAMSFQLHTGRDLLYQMSTSHFFTSESVSQLRLLLAISALTTQTALAGGHNGDVHSREFRPTHERLYPFPSPPIIRLAATILPTGGCPSAAPPTPDLNVGRPLSPDESFGCGSRDSH